MIKKEKFSGVKSLVRKDFNVIEKLINNSVCEKQLQIRKYLRELNELLKVKLGDKQENRFETDDY